MSNRPNHSLPAALTNSDVEILTRQQALDREEHRWVHETPLGQIFTLGVWVALFVGVAIVYQVLSTDIANMMGEYATLKAMGYGAKYLTKVVLMQAVLLAVVGYIPSIIVSWGLYRLVEKAFWHANEYDPRHCRLGTRAGDCYVRAVGVGSPAETVPSRSGRLVLDSSIS